MGPIISQRFLYLYILLGLAILTHLSFITHWADSELWAITLARVFYKEIADFSVNYKYLFFSYLSFCHFFTNTSLGSILVARLLFLILAFCSLFLIYIISYNYARSKNMALLSVALILSCSFFLSRGFRVRSDIMLSFLFLLGVTFFLYYQKNKNIYYLMIAPIVNIVMLLTSPKSIYYLLLLAIFMVSTYLVRKRDRHILKYLCFTFVPLIILTIPLFLIKYEQIKGALIFFMTSFEAKTNHPAYMTIDSFVYIFRFLKENPLFSILTIHGSFLALKNILFKRNLYQLPYDILLLSTLLILFLHNDKLPFFICSLLPIICIYNANLILNLIEKISSPLFLSLVRRIIPILLVVKLVNFYFIFATKNNNHEQIKSLKIITNYLDSYPNATYYDGMGAIPKRNKFFIYSTVDHPNNKHSIFAMLEKEQPDLIFFSHRLALYGSQLTKFLMDNSYVPIGGFIFAKGMNLNSEKKVNEQYFTADFKQYDLPNSNDQIHLYSGPYYIGLKPDTVIVETNDTTPNTISPPYTYSMIKNYNSQIRIKSIFPAISYSKYRPIRFPKNMNFFEIFDFDPNY